MNNKLNEIKVFRDPLYGYIKVYDLLMWEIIQTQEFQRLRRIHQLGGTHMVYHTAEHSRFSHSLGVYEVARRIIYEVTAIRTTLSREERMITLCAALLHDIGHGPFSHAFETVFTTNHEDYTIKIILGDTEVNEVLRSFKPDFPQKVASVIKKKNSTGLNHNHFNIMTNLITSQLDADRLDYLQRDTYFTGATYGGIDLERIIRSFLVVEGRIAFKYTSMHAIENYLMSRYHMYWQVYFHPTGVSYEVLLIKIFSRIRDLLKENFLFNTNLGLLYDLLLNSRDVDLNDYIKLDETWMLYKIKCFEQEGDSILSDLSNRLLNRRLFKHSVYTSESITTKTYEQLTKLFKQASIDPNYYLYMDFLSKRAYDYYDEKALNNSPIELYRNGSLVEIADISEVVKGITNVATKKEYKIYYADDELEKISDENLYNKIKTLLK